MDWILWIFIAWIVMFTFAALILMTAHEGYEDHNGFHHGKPPEKDKDSF
jgi:hypothetical protein